MGALAVLLVVVPTLVVLVSLALPSGSVAAPTGERLRRVDTATRRWRVAGLLVGVAAAVVALGWDGLGRGQMLAGPLVALGLLAGVLVGELRVGAPGGLERRASLELRRVRDVLPRGLTAAAAACVGYLLALLGVTTAMGSADDLGRAGRALAIQCSAVLSEARTPWPGSYYSVPLAALVVGGVLAAALAVHRIVRRPRQGEDKVQDDELRRHAARAVVAAVGLLAVVPLTGVVAVSAIALSGFGCAPPAWRAAVVVLVATLPLIGAAATWFAVVLVRTSRLYAPHPPLEDARR